MEEILAQCVRIRQKGQLGGYGLEISYVYLKGMLAGELLLSSGLNLALGGAACPQIWEALPKCQNLIRDRKIFLND